MKKSSMFISVLIMLIFGSAMVLTSCDKDPVGPSKAASVHLVPLTSNMAKDVYVGEDGNEYLAMKHLPILQKMAGSDISYGDINATTDLMYVLMNTGNVPVFNVKFSTNDLLTIPETIGLLNVSSSGSQISALPIVHIIKEHVKPYSGVGSLLPFDVGNFTDTLTLSYQYEDGSDTALVSDNYPVSGTKMGAVVDIYLSGKDINEYDLIKQELSVAGLDNPFISLWEFSSDELDTIVLQNNGNAAIETSVIGNNHMGDFSYILNSPLEPDSSMTLIRLIRGDQYVELGTTGQMIIFGANESQPYIIGVANKTWVNGSAGLLFAEH